MKDLTGRQFGRLIVLGVEWKDKYNRLYWGCLCLCGEYSRVRGDHLKSGATRSCGCIASRGHIVPEEAGSSTEGEKNENDDR